MIGLIVGIVFIGLGLVLAKANGLVRSRDRAL